MTLDYDKIVAFLDELSETMQAITEGVTEGNPEKIQHANNSMQISIDELKESLTQ